MIPICYLNTDIKNESNVSLEIVGKRGRTSEEEEEKEEEERGERGLFPYLPYPPPTVERTRQVADNNKPILLLQGKREKGGGGGRGEGEGRIGGLCGLQKCFQFPSPECILIL